VQKRDLALAEVVRRGPDQRDPRLEVLGLSSHDPLEDLARTCGVVAGEGYLGAQDVDRPVGVQRGGVLQQAVGMMGLDGGQPRAGGRRPCL
jgi:hypothetical protein